MTASFGTSLKGLDVAEKNLRVRANNIANASTYGFKRARMDLESVTASGALGSGQNIIGSGVAVKSVTQQFTQGIIEGADSALDMAIAGEGFFVLESDNAPRTYTRGGAFQLDNQGFIGDGGGRKLVGFVTDEQGLLTGAQGALSVKNTILDPKSSTSIVANLNLNAAAQPKAQAFQAGFTPGNPPNPNTYNEVSTVTVYDSLGKGHEVSSYFVKAPLPNTWRIYIGIDGTDVTPTAATPPAGGTSIAPVAYPTGSSAIPFTMIFDELGNYIPYSVGSPPEHYGSLATGGVYPTSTVGGFATMNSLPTIGTTDLKINGVPIIMTSVTDNLSSSDQAASAISLVSAINDYTNLHGVTASVVGTTATLTGVTVTGTGAIGAGELVINGIDVVIPVVTGVADIVNAINAGAGLIPNVSAANVAGNLVLTSPTGVNITIQTDGSSAPANSTTFTEISTTSGVSANIVQRSAVQLAIPGEQPIVIGGNAPNNAGFTVGNKYGVIQTSSDPINISFDPASGAQSLQTIKVDYQQSSQFSSAFAIQSLDTDGYETGRLTSLDTSDDGVITARFSNNQSSIIGQVALARFANQQGLKDVGRTSFEQTRESGLALLGVPKSSSLGKIQSGNLERSNVDLTAELVGLIEAQRDFGANAQALRTADQITQIILNLR